MAAKKGARRGRRACGAALRSVGLAALLGVGALDGFEGNAGVWTQTATAQGLTRLEVGNPDAETFLGVGLWSC